MNAASLQPGDALGVPAPVARGLTTVTHVGIVSDRRDWSGRPFVINASKRTGIVLEETWEDFSQGAPVTKLSLVPELPRHQVVRRARSRIGERWDLVEGNCEHFVRDCMGLVRTSPQLVAAGCFILGGLALGGIVLAALAAAAAPQPRHRRG